MHLFVVLNIDVEHNMLTCECNAVERNLNPKAACLKRREEEKNEEAGGRPMLLGPPVDMAQQIALAGNHHLLRLSCVLLYA